MYLIKVFNYLFFILTTLLKVINQKVPEGQEKQNTLYFVLKVRRNRTTAKINKTHTVYIQTEKALNEQMFVSFFHRHTFSLII